MPSISSKKIKTNMFRILHNIFRIQPIPQKKTVEEASSAMQGKVIYHEESDTSTADEWGGTT